jgi:DNA (cytosine-5)-methyltransferase 1
VLTFLDFFAGAGGFRRGMELAGHKCLGFCEWDPFPVKSYKAMHLITDEQYKYLLSLPFKERQKEIDKEEYFNGEWYSNDVRAVDAGSMPRADVWCFGFPCQDISIAGKQLGFNGNRSSLFFTVTRIIRDTREEDRPTTLFIENVKNLLSVNGGIDFLKLLIELDEIGYDAEWQVLNSKDFGVPQNRERVFIVGHIRGRSRREVFPIGGTDTKASIIEELKINDNRHSSLMNSVLNTQGISPALDCMQGGNRQPKVLLMGNVNPSGNGMNGNVFDSRGLSPTLTTNKGEGSKIMVREATKQGYAIAEPGDSINLEQPNSATRRGRVGKGIEQTLTTQCNQAVLRPVRTEYGKEIRKDYEAGNIEISRHEFLRLEQRTDGVTNTVSTVQKDNLLVDGLRIRKLTPRECFRLQGWEDAYFERAAMVNSDSQLYKQAGNGVTVNVIQAIAERL